MEKVEPPAHQRRLGFFTDQTLCIGCKACEVACKQWNQLPAETPRWTGHSYDNTDALSDTSWRHVLFVEKPRIEGATPTWLMLSDVCKHCGNAPCLDACPSGAIIRTEFDSVYVQNDVCNGCGYCVVACPFGVIARNPIDGGAHKCTLCYDRLKVDLEPACAKACPTDSIQFGDLDELRQRANHRLGELHQRGVSTANLYGADDEMLGRGLNAFFLLTDPPATYNLPAHPVRPVEKTGPSYLSSLAMAAGLLLAGALAFRRGRK
ncbi:MAG TPA: 4Fe-4S dicluster domain-containing protein [Chloroflexota bacterium]